MSRGVFSIYYWVVCKVGFKVGLTQKDYLKFKGKGKISSGNLQVPRNLTKVYYDEMHLRFTVSTVANILKRLLLSCLNLESVWFRKI